MVSRTPRDLGRHTQSLLGVQTLTIPRSQSLTTQWAITLIHVMNEIHIPSPCRLTNTRRNLPMGNLSRLSPDSYHPTLGLSDNHDRVSLGNRTFGHLRGSLTPIQKFWISPRVSYTHTEVLDISTGLLHQLRTFRILPRVSFTQIPGFSPEGINSPLLASPNTH